MMRHRFPSQYTTLDQEAPKSVDLPALIAARICHDLISPLGAIGNGMELMQMAPSSNAPEAELLRESVQQAQGRIRFFRIAFGSFRPDQMIAADELAGLLRDYRATARFELFWSPHTSQTKTTVKLALLGLMCLEIALPYGGQVELSQDGCAVFFTASSDRIKLEDRLWDTLQSSDGWPQDLRPAWVQFPLLQNAVAEQGMSLAVNTTKKTIDLRITAG